MTFERESDENNCFSLDDFAWNMILLGQDLKLIWIELGKTLKLYSQSTGRS